MRGYELYGNDLVRSKPVNASDPMNFIEQNGRRVPEVLQQGAFEHPLPLYFDIPILDCPNGHCISPVEQPNNFNAPCSGDAKFRIASGLSEHPFFDEICRGEYAMVFIMSLKLK